MSRRNRGFGAITVGGTVDAYASSSEYGSDYRAAKTAYGGAEAIGGSWASGVTSGVVVAALSDDLISELDSSAAESAEENERKEDQFRKGAYSLGTAVSTYCPACAPFVAAALLVMEGALYLADAFEDDQNSQADKDRVFAALDRYAQLGLVPPAYRSDMTIGAKGYAAILDTGLGYVAALTSDQQASVYQIGELVKKHGAKPMLYAWTDRAAMFAGTAGGAPFPYNTPIASEMLGGIVAAAVALEYDLPLEPLLSLCRDVAETQRKAGGYEWMARAYATAARFALEYGASNAPATPVRETITLPGGVTIYKDSVRRIGTIDSRDAAALAEVALAGVKTATAPTEGGSTPITGTQLAVGGGIVAGVGLFVAKSAAGAGIRAALSRLFR